LLPALVEILRFGTNHSCIAPRFYSKWHGNPASVEDAARTEPKQETPSSEKANRKDGKKETTNLVAAASLAWPQPFPLGRLRASSCGTASRRDAFLLRRSPRFVQLSNAVTFAGWCASALFSLRTIPGAIQRLVAPQRLDGVRLSIVARHVKR
jgi:hypothetical protein